MIHTIFELTRPFLVIDCETTGLNPEQNRIIELGIEVYTAAGLERDGERRFNPGCPIPPETTAIHHISDEDVADKPRFEELAKSLAKLMSNCDFGGKNVRFDLEFVAAEMARANVPWSYADAYIIDAEQLERRAVPRTLSDLYEKYTGKKADGAHQALNDVKMTTEVLVGQLQTHTKLSRNLKVLHDFQWPGWLAKGFVWAGDDVVITFGKHRDKRLQEIPRDYFTYILRENFSADQKKIARDALAGKYPVK